MNFFAGFLVGLGAGLLLALYAFARLAVIGDLRKILDKCGV
jgi:hypothetical protein